MSTFSKSSKYVWCLLAPVTILHRCIVDHALQGDVPMHALVIACKAGNVEAAKWLKDRLHCNVIPEVVLGTVD